MASSPTSSPHSDASSLPGSGNDDIGVGLSDPQLSGRRRKMLDLVNELHSTGVQVDIDLPMIAVIGSQSAGKSSLIESISGITLPRAAGTCTRVPTECRLSHSHESWRCLVTLRFLTDERGQRLGQAKNIPFGATMYHKSEVEERIRRAQRAVLNPSKNPKDFLEGDDEDSAHREFTFSSNCVSLQISGPEVADLSFCDLPGLIANVGAGGNANDIKLVESLIKSYIEKDSCIILLAITCETDFNNQGAYEFAKNVDPKRQRTIGVLTKPDRIPSGDEEHWLRLIRNESESLVHNWYCVKQPDGKALKSGITWEEARCKEDEFFSMTTPWSTMDAMHQKYLRSTNLTERLSAILSELVSKRLPMIHETLQTSLKETQDGLNELPRAPSSDPFSEVLNLLHLFVRDIERHMEGTPDPGGLLQTIRPYQEVFKSAILSTAPDFRPFEKGSPGSRKVVDRPDFVLNEEEASISVSESVVREITQDDTNSIYIDEVMARARSARTRELPDNYPFVISQTFINEVTQKWSAPAYRLHEETRVALEQYSYQLIDKRLSAVGRGDLGQRVRLVLADHMKNWAERAGRRIDALIHMEARPFTMSSRLYLDYRSKFLAHYKGLRDEDKNGSFMNHLRQYRLNPVYSPNVTRVTAALAELGIRCNAADLTKMLPADPMEPAMAIMAAVSAYFQVAYKRFIDNVIIAIDDQLVLGIKQDLEVALTTGLGITGSEGRRICADLTQESRNVASRRKELNAKRERLEAARNKLIQLGSL